MFLTEKELRDKFWKNYNYGGRALRYRFEASIRQGDADLVTVEIFQDRVQFNAFEFKLSDVRKAILQAKANAPYVHKSWIVLPEEKKDLVNNKYRNLLDEIRYVGVIVVAESGMWSTVYQPKFRNDVSLSNEILKIMLLSV